MAIDGRKRTSPWKLRTWTKEQLMVRMVDQESEIENLRLKLAWSEALDALKRRIG